MSLLLDALKKAAEKKAAKGDDAPEGVSADETVADATQLDQTVAGKPDETMQMGPLHDDTQLDQTQIKPPADDTDLGQQSLRDAMEAEVADETVFDQTEFDQTEMQTQLMGQESPAAAAQEPPVSEDSTQTQSGERTDLLGTEDETMVFDDDDVSEFLGDPRYINEAEDTEVPTQSMQPTDDTDVATQSMPVAGDDTETGAPPAPSGDDTDIAEMDHGEDMSLLLVDDEQTQTGVKTLTSVTDPRQPPKRADLVEDSTEAEGLSLEGATETGSASATTRTAGSVTTQVGASSNEPTYTRSESTGTATYAPDNYDRTLMRVPNEDASKLFAGMSSDTEVVMTPDYAKKVFQSKSTAQRWQNFRAYSGIGLVILLAVGILGLFEFQGEVETIDNSLRPLTRDPMPGPIVTARQDNETNLFASAPEEVDERTRQLVETANKDGGESAVAEQQPAAESVAVEPATTGESTSGTVATVEESQPEAPAVAEPVDDSPEIEVASIAADEQTQPVTTAQPETGPESSLSITSSMKTADKDIWLREAYAAYRSGDDALALEKYNQVLEVDPSNRNALLARAAIAIQNNRSSDAVRDYQRLLEANPRDSLAMSSMMAVSSVAPKQAESQLKLMLRDEPNSPHLNFALGNVYGVQNRWQEAQRHYFTALENNPDDPNYAYNLAISLEHIAKPEVAASFYQRALDNFDMGLATFNRQVVEQRLGALQ